MTYQRLKYYFKNCFLLLIPVLLWNIIFTSYLPEVYTNTSILGDIPAMVRWGEIIAFLSILVLSLMMPLKIKTGVQKLGLIIYFAGLAIYLLAWRPIILYPNGDWSSSFLGFISLAFLPLILLVGIGMLGNKYYFKLQFSRGLYIVLSFILIFLGTWHAILLYNLTH